MTILRLFRDGSRLEFGKGHLDQWTVYLARPHAAKVAADEAESLARLERLAAAQGPQLLYADFIVIYHRCNYQIQPYMFDLIHAMGRSYGERDLEVEVAFSMAYAGMVALERRHRSRPGVKRRRRLGVHMLLVEGRGAAAAAALGRAMSWDELAAACAARGF